ncbi:Vigilin [Hypsibius exemplaris]|uniref:Vigilin n=1 Tax=Hypsibius exemplaris TaxID=2072580 RepID=A0A1W0WA99_HYPEX|nr:Vigilin [Hypsibius exemplaris]
MVNKHWVSRHMQHHSIDEEASSSRTTTTKTSASAMQLQQPLSAPQGFFGNSTLSTGLALTVAELDAVTLEYKKKKAQRTAPAHHTEMQNNNNHASGSAATATDNGLSYTDAFPSLPDTGRAALPTTSPWAARPPGHARLAVQSNNAVEKLVISYEERRLKTDETRFGKEAESEKSVLRDIQKETGATINMTQNKDGSIVLLITGKREEARRARNIALQKLQTQANVVLNIPKEYHRFLLGAKGQTKQDLEALTATKIFVPRMDDPSDAIRITGPKEGLDVARDRIQAIYEEQSKKGAERLEIPKIYHPLIQGPHGKVVDALTQKTGVRINIPPPHVQKDEISISGEREAVAYVKNELLRLCSDIAQKSKEIQVEVPREQHRYIQGPRGVNLHSILETTGVWVELPPSNSDSNSVTLRGNPAKFGEALNIVFAKANSVVRLEVKAPTWVHKHMIGRGGEKVRDMAASYPEVRITYTEEDKINLEGPPNDVDTVRRLLEAESKELVSTLAVQEMKIDEKFMKHIIGKNGSNVSRLKSELGVQIRSADQTRPNILIVEGPKDAVAEAVKVLKERVTKMENERARDIIIDRNLHKLIIGQKGERIREIRDTFKDTNILFPDAEEKSDVVTIRGPKEEVDKCFKYVEKLVKELIISNHRIEVPIFKDMHRAIIGRGGATIRKIREETDTKIDLPSENSDSDVIVITGKKENAEKAKVLIQKIQNEVANAVEVKVSIPNKLHTHLIGAKGRTIQGIIQECGNVNVQLPPPGSTSDEIIIRGPKVDAEKARDLLQKIAQDRELSSYTVDVQAKQEYHKYISGQNRTNIARLRDRYNVRIVIPSASAEERDIISIIGKKEDVERAKVEIEKTVKELQNTIDDTVDIPLNQHSRFRARRGEAIEHILEQAGSVTINFPDEGETIKMRGPRDAVETAKRLLLKRVEDWNSEITIEVDIPAKYYGHVMGPKGSRVSNIQHDFDVHIKFPERQRDNRNNNGNGPKQSASGVNGGAVNGDGGESPEHNGNGVENGSEHSETEVKKEVVTVTGQPDAVESAKEALLALVPVEDEVEIAYDLHRKIIGQGGANIRRLMDLYQVNINVPNSDQNSSIIRLTGLPKAVEAAKKGLVEEAEQLQLRNFQLELRVDPKYHFKLIGSGGTEVRKLRAKFDVDVQFPRPNDAPENADRIVLIGLEEKANAAKDYIQAVIEDLESKVVLDVPLDSRIHARIIGGKGLNLRKLMDRFKVDIRFPRRDEGDSNQVTITGDEANVYEAEAELKRLEDVYLDDVAESDALRSYHAPSRNQDHQLGDSRSNGQGFVVKGAPWQQQQRQASGDHEVASPQTGDLQEFPGLGNGAAAVPVSAASRWGPLR